MNNRLAVFLVLAFSMFLGACGKREGGYKFIELRPPVGESGERYSGFIKFDEGEIAYAAFYRDVDLYRHTAGRDDSTKFQPKKNGISWDTGRFDGFWYNGKFLDALPNQAYLIIGNSDGNQDGMIRELDLEPHEIEILTNQVGVVNIPTLINRIEQIPN